jgi:hypothetical protein
MYKLSEQQIDFILKDIRSRGVKSESLQQSLLDHIICIIEKDLEENGNFEKFYLNTIDKFHAAQLHEIERETKLILTYKNLPLMKKTMIISGILSAIALIFGIHHKFMQYPQADIFLSTGILSGSLIFMPLFFILKIGNEKDRIGKLIIASAIVSGLLLSLSALFKLLHLPYSNQILFVSTLIMAFVFLPLFGNREFRKPESRTNALSITVLIIFFYSLLISVHATPGVYYPNKKLYTQDYIRNEKILSRELHFFAKKNANSSQPFSTTVQNLMKSCEDLKNLIRSQVSKYAIVDENEPKEMLVEDLPIHFSPIILNNFKNLKERVKEYNASLSDPDQRFPEKASFLDTDYYKARVSLVLNEIVQVQMFVLQNERELVAMK